ncbi:RAMP superfamily CRISPR-associated protein [Vibrio sp.]|uniref:RAMP superfamily CRISPR-associated protein n=1 Tax=Vibrio sp. TaxID=678 RepID=UPI003D0FB86B
MIEYSVFMKQQLDSPLQQLEQAAIDLENAKEKRNRNSRKDAETRLRKAAQQCADIEPTIAYIWLKAIGSNFDDQIREAWKPRVTNSIQDWGSLNLNTGLPEIAHFPSGSWALQFTFTLRKPYISRDDTDFYILDNPVKKEKVFKVPYVASSQWKGALRAAMVQELVADLRNRKIDETAFIEKRLQYYYLFGNEKDGMAEFLNRAQARYKAGEPIPHKKEDHTWQESFEAKVKEIGEAFETMLRGKGYRQGEIEGFQGHLYFYPTYFEKIGLEVINPHPRKTGGGKSPIYFECVPEDDVKGVFTLLDVPLSGPELSPKEIQEQASSDLQAVAKGIRAMMTSHGFGAKTSSGFGVANVDWKKANIKPEKFQYRWQGAWQEELK